jgi:hypothetical protein
VNLVPINKMEEEIWKTNKDGYQVSSLGRAMTKMGKLCVPSTRNRGRAMCGGKSVARMVYQEFVGEIPKGYLVYHKDTDNLNNRPENLFLATISEKTAKFATKPPLKITDEEFISRARTTHGDFYDYSNLNFKKINNKVNITCPIHGEFKQIASDHTAGHGCHDCYHEKSRSWSEEEDLVLTQNYEMGTSECMKLLPRKSRSAIMSRAFTIGIAKKSARIFDSEIPGFIWHGVTSRAGDQKKSQMAQLDFEREYLWELYLKQHGKCAMTGWDIKFGQTGAENTVSVDRINSKEGYIKSNIQLVHKDVNRMKNAFSDEYFYKVCKAVTANRQSEFVESKISWEWDHWNNTEIPVSVWRDSTENFTK